MSIDWITVAAQIANFLVLVWLLKRFLYRPILDGIDAREGEISHRMQEAVTAKQESEKAQETYREKVAALNLAQSEMTETIRKSAEVQRDELFTAAREGLAQERTDWQSQLDQDTRHYFYRLNAASASALLSLTSKALTDLAGESLEAQIAQRLAAQIAPLLSNLDGKATKAMVTSQAPLSPTAQKAFKTALKSSLPNVTLQFETAPAQAAGIVMRIGASEVSWTVDSYVAGLEALVRDRLRSNSDMKVKNDAA
ncbi:MAG: F0F1 ATP synthase subunit B [Yoonia sp.]